jgi:hypothetical protein
LAGGDWRDSSMKVLWEAMRLVYVGLD